MDRRQKKTQNAIFSAFTLLLQNKRYENITVQDIIDKADIGRSTFYAHFETKDELLNSMCKRIFDHVFSEDLLKEKMHDFSDKPSNLKDKLTHLLYHFKEKKDVVCSILSGDSRDIFVKYFKENLYVLFSNDIPHNNDVPYEYLLHHYVCAYSEAVNWWAEKKMEIKPEELIEYYYSTNRLKGHGNNN